MSRTTQKDTRDSTLKGKPGNTPAAPVPRDILSFRAAEPVHQMIKLEARRRKVTVSNGKPAPINPATGLPWSSGSDHSIEGRGNIQHSTFNAQNPTGHSVLPAPNNAAVMPVVRPAAGSGSSPAANGGDDTAVRNATAALDLLTTTAGKLNTAFAALATRADALFKNGNGLQFAPAGQMGGSYPGKTH